MSELKEIKSLLISMGLNDYQAAVLAFLLLLGEAKATTLSKVSNVPTARIYDVLDGLVRMGLVRVRPGRPAFYSAIPPEDVVSSLISWRLEEMRREVRYLEDLGRRFIEVASKIYLKGKKGLARKPLIRIVSVGKTSEEETRRLYKNAKREILIFSQAFEYFPRVSKELVDAVDRGVRIKIILKSPSKLDVERREKQKRILSMIREVLGNKVNLRFADEVPLRGCIIDPNEEGGALFLVEEPGVLFEFREAAITFNPSLAKALALMFELLWSSSKELF